MAQLRLRVTTSAFMVERDLIAANVVAGVVWRVAARWADGLNHLDEYLRPMPIAGEALRFDLSAYCSTVTREMAQLRLRVTARAFMVGRDLIAANVVAGGDVLEVDAGAL